MKIITIEDVRNIGLYPDPSRYIPEDWSGTALDILRMENISANDRLMLVLKENVLDLKTLRLYAVWCGRQSLSMVENPDPRSINACDVAERYANNEASEEELREAVAAVRDAWIDARSADSDHTFGYETHSLKYYAAHAAASAVSDAFYAASNAAAFARWDKSQADWPDWQHQVQHLIHMIETTNQ